MRGEASLLLAANAGVRPVIKASSTSIANLLPSTKSGGIIAVQLQLE